MEGRHCYQPLRNPRAFRLLSLQPGSREQPVKCDLWVINLPEGGSGSQHLPRYEAVSYVWGPAKITQEIVLNGWQVRVRENLWQFLLQARHTTRTRTLWVDALCVNQANIKERNSQVQMMGDIYRCAEQVLVWLGAGDDASNRAMTFLNRISEHSKQEISQSVPLREALLSLVSRQYWTRTWVVQEFLLAKKAKLMCGSFCIDWQELHHLQKILPQTSHLPHLTPFLEELHQCDAFSLLRQRACGDITKLPFLELVAKNKHRKCFDPRDKVYAMLSLSTEFSSSGAIDVDYEKNPRYIVLDVLRICHIAASDQVQQGQFLHDLLKVHDWEAAHPQQSLKNLKVGSGMLRHPEAVDVTGFPIGEVIHVSSTEQGRRAAWISADTMRHCMIGLSVDELSSMIAELEQLDQQCLNTSAGMLDALNASLHQRTEAGRFQNLCLHQGRQLIVVFTSFCWKKKFLVGFGSGAAFRKKDKIIGFIGSRNVLVVRERVFGFASYQVVGRAICVESRARQFHPTCHSSTGIHVLANAGQCANTNALMAMELQGYAFSMLLGSVVSQSRS